MSLRRRIWIGMSLCAVLAGAAFIHHGIERALTIARRKSWPTAEGKVVGLESIGRKVTFDYVVAGATHRDFDYDHEEPVASGRYSLGKTVTVRYDPDDPARGRLSPGDERAVVPPIVFGAVMILVGIAALALHFHLESGRAPDWLRTLISEGELRVPLWSSWGMAMPIVVLLPFIAMGSYMLRLALDLRNWPATEGVVIRSHVSTYRTGGPEAGAMDVEFEYSAAGMTRRGQDRVGAAAADSIGRRYRPGERVPVYYSLAQPERASLQASIHRERSMLLVVGPLVIVVSLLGVLVFGARFYGYLLVRRGERLLANAQESLDRTGAISEELGLETEQSEATAAVSAARARLEATRAKLSGDE